MEVDENRSADAARVRRGISEVKMGGTQGSTMKDGSAGASAAKAVVHALDPSLPLSQALCEVLLPTEANEHGAGPIDLSSTMLLVPGARLASSLSRRLLARARASGRPLFAPVIVTPKRFGPNFVEPTAAFMSDVASLCSWREALEQSISAKDGFAARVAAIFGVPGDPDPRVRMRIARRIGRLSSEVAAAMHSFDSIASGAAAKSRRDVGAKFEVLSEFARRRNALLSKAGVVDRDDAIRDGVRAGRLLHDGVHRLVVLLADPEPVQRVLLRRLCERGVRVEVCVHRTDSIDDDGFPIAEAWERHPFTVAQLPSEAIRVANGPTDAADAALAAIRGIVQPHGAALSTEDLFVMAPDDETRRALERSLVLAAAPAAGGESRVFAATRLGTLLARLGDLLGEGSAEALAAFVRHDDVARWLSSIAPDAADRVSAYRAKTLVGAWRDEPVRSVEGGGRRGESEATQYAEVRAAVLELCRPLEGTRPAADWAKPLRAVLRTIIGDGPPQGAVDETAAAVRALDRELGELHELPKAFSAAIGAHEAIELLSTRLTSQEIQRSHGCDGVTIGGWLDAGMADEPHLVLAGFVEGCVPEGAVADPLLPEAVRSALGMMSGVRRAARDAWILDGILMRTAARARVQGDASVSFIVPQQSEEGDPLKPSRFLLRVEDGALADRVSLLFPTGHREHRPRIESGAGVPSLFERTPKIEGVAIEAMSVTSFKSFLECPYLFQLRCDARLGLSAIDERLVELDARGFGNLVHAALEKWGREEIAGGRRTEDPAVIERGVIGHLDALVALSYPKSRAPALRVQVELARRRLRRFAQIQAEEAQKGWKVHLVEASFSKNPSHDGLQAPRVPAVDGLYLTGRIDRVDVCESTGRFRALDYKTSAKGESPVSVHLRKTKLDDGTSGDRWVDLQLPLYRVLLRSMPKPIEVGLGELGYLNLAPTAEKSAILMLEGPRVTEQLLDAAEDLAEDIVRRVVAGELSPSERIPIRPDDPLAPIWGLGQRGIADDDSSTVGEASFAGGDEH